LNRYKSNKPNEFLIAPAPLTRGKITAKDLTKITSAEECVELIMKWADEVYHAWNSNHGTVAQIADGFLDKYYN
jgi:predicted transcriptional regulator YdeE